MSLSLLFGRISTASVAVARPRLSAAAASAAVNTVLSYRHLSGNELGRGAGKGGGAGGSIREAGGSLGKSQAAKEEEYFRRLEREQLATMQKNLADEVAHHEREIAHHLEAIKKHKASMEKLGGDEKDEHHHKHGKGCHHDSHKKK